MFLIFAKNAFNASPRTGPKIFVQSVANTFCRKSSIFCKIALISSPFVAIRTTSPTIAAMISAIGFEANHDSIFPRPGITVVVSVWMPPEILEIIESAGDNAATTSAIVIIISS